MIEATQLKNGRTFLLDGKPYKVINYAHQKIGRGGANVKLSLRNLESGNLEEKTLNSSAKVEEVETTKKDMQFLFKDDTGATFMDPRTYDQKMVPVHLIEQGLHYIKEGDIVNILFWDERPLSIEIAPKVILKVEETDPGVKGNSAANVYKPAKLESGLEIKVPLFIKPGDKVRIDTKTGEYVERVKL